jgi:hypothetical protein
MPWTGHVPKGNPSPDTSRSTRRSYFFGVLKDCANVRLTQQPVSQMGSEALQLNDMSSTDTTIRTTQCMLYGQVVQNRNTGKSTFPALAGWNWWLGNIRFDQGLVVQTRLACVLN